MVKYTEHNKPSIKVDKLSKSFDTHKVVDNISFEANAGDVVGFLGPNGAGKTTTMRMLTGFLTPSSGNAYVNGYSIQTDMHEAKKNIGYLPEGSPLYFDMTVKDFLTFIANIRGIQGRKLSNRLEYLMNLLSLNKTWNNNIESLSKGFKRRVGLASALIHDPSVLILDEPTDGLDPNQKHEVRKLINTLAKDKVIIISTHILEEVEMVCNRSIIINQGKIIEDTTPRALIEKSTIHNTVVITVNNTTIDNVLDTLQGVSYIENIEIIEETPNQISVSVKTAPSNLNHLNAIINQTNWNLNDFYLRRGQLDEVFRTITNTVTEE